MAGVFRGNMNCVHNFITESGKSMIARVNAMRMRIEKDITEFRQAFGLPINEKPTLLESKDMQLHIKLIREELEETIVALWQGDLTEVFDGVVDMMYVIGGLAVHMGLPLEEGWKEVHSSNMSKLDENGEPIYREDGKVLKSHLFREPRLDVILEAHSESQD